MFIHATGRQEHQPFQFRDAIPSLDRIRLALDSVGGASALRLAASLAEGGTLAVYGAISGKNLEINPKDLFYKGIRIPAGFYVYKWTADPANRKVCAAKPPYTHNVNMQT